MGTGGSSLSQQSAIETINQWRLKPQQELIFDSGRREISQYMQAVAKLQQSPRVSNELITTAMARLKREFHSVLRRHADHHHQSGALASTTELSVTDSTACVVRYEDYRPPELPGENVVAYLRSIAERMSCSGKLGECMSVYKSVRRTFLEAELRRIHFEELSGSSSSSGDGLTRRLPWDELKVKIELWVQISRICVFILFAREKLLCEQVFDGLGGDKSSARDECFAGTVRDSADRLFAFARAVSSSNLPHVRMGAVLGLYEAFFTVLPNVGPLFSCEPGRGIVNVCSETLTRIESDVGRMLYDFESSVLREVSNVRDDDRGEVCQSAKYVMDQVNVIVRNKRILTSLINSSPSLEFGDVIISREGLEDYFANRSFLEIHLILVIAALQMNLENKSKLYKDPSLGILFVMNNVRYIVQRIEESKELQQMIGDSRMNKLNENLKIAVDRYQASICGKLLKCFENKGLYVTRCFQSRLSKTALRDRLRAFNARFEEVQNLCSVWTVPDLQIRDMVRVSISQKLVPAYKNFLEKFNGNPETRLLKEKHIQYSAEDLEHLVLNTLFA